MFWTLTTALGSYLFIVLAIVPHVIISLFSRTGNVPHLIDRAWARFSLLCAHVRPEVRGAENMQLGPAVPITVIGSREVLPKHGRKVRPGTIILNIGRPIDPGGGITRAP